MKTGQEKTMNYNLYGFMRGKWRRKYSDGGKVFGDYYIIKGEKVQG